MRKLRGLRLALTVDGDDFLLAICKESDQMVAVSGCAAIDKSWSDYDSSYLHER